MKRIVFLAVVAVLIAVPALAQDPVQPVGPYEVEVFLLDDNGMYTGAAGQAGDPMALARCFASNEATGNCNKRYWYIPVTVHASVAQWINFSFTGTRWDWFVRKPGWYAANCITAKVASNGDILIDYEGFDDLVSLMGNPTPIPIWYSFGASIQEAQDNGWVPGPLLNDDDDLLDERILGRRPQLPARRTDMETLEQNPCSRVQHGLRVRGRGPDHPRPEPAEDLDRAESRSTELWFLRGSVLRADRGDAVTQ